MGFRKTRGFWSCCNLACRILNQIRVLEGNIQKAETEICRLDALVEKIRLVSSNLCYVLRVSSPFKMPSGPVLLRKSVHMSL